MAIRSELQEQDVDNTPASNFQASHREKLVQQLKTDHDDDNLNQSEQRRSF